MFLLNSVTTVRNLFGSPAHVEWRDRIARGELDGPTMITAGPILDGDPPVWPGSDVVTTPEAARAAVQAQKAAGYDWLKVYNGLSAEVYDAILAEAKVQGMPVGGHVPRAVGIERAIASGQRTIEHLDGYVPFFSDPHVSPEIIAATARAEVWNRPTDRDGAIRAPGRSRIARGNARPRAGVADGAADVGNPKNDFRLQRFTPEMFEGIRKKNEIRRRLVADLAKAGAKLVLGTDTGNPFVVPGFAIHEEIALLAAAGLTPWQILRTATVAPAEMLGTPGAFGAIVPGARADLLLLDGDPLADLTAARSPSVVVARGKGSPARRAPSRDYPALKPARRPLTGRAGPITSAGPGAPPRGPSPDGHAFCARTR
jgi:imidazolonepropionase-like amidohydrolase